MRSGGIKVLMIGSDRKLFEEGSAVASRIAEYGKGVEELHIVVFTLKSLGLKEKNIAPNVWLYPTNSFSKLTYVNDATNLGRKIVFDRKFVRGQSLITTQDPFESGLAGLGVKKKWRLPMEVQLHTDPFSPYFSGLLNTTRKSIAKKVLKEAESIRVVSENLKLKIENSMKIENSKPASPAGRLKINILPIYIDKERIEGAPIAYDLHARYGWHFILLAVGRLEPEKNFSLAIKILALVCARFPNTGLVIVGSGSEEGKLKALAKKLGVEQNVAFAGWQESMASYYKTANVFLQTSHFEGYGMALVEAGLSGLPVVTTPVGLAQDLTHGSDAYIYPHERPEAFVEGIVDLIEHNHKRENLKTNLKRTLEQKLLSKEDYLQALYKNWQETANKVHA